MRHYLSNGPGNSQDLAVAMTLESKVNEQLDSIAASIPRLAEIVNDADTVESRANAIGTAARQIKEDIDNRLAELLTLLHQAR